MTAFSTVGPETGSPTISAAYRRIRNYVVRTPLVRLPWLDAPNRTVFAKLECWQRTGSFKVRGAFNALLQPNDRRPVVAASAGNHGLAVASAAGELDRQCSICLPMTASDLKARRMIAAGADVIPVGRDLHEAMLFARQSAQARSGRYLSPYADADVIDGQGTVMLEADEQGGPFDVVLAPIGGGGLALGIAKSVRELQRATRVVGLHPAAFQRDLSPASLRRSLSLPVTDTIADGLAVQALYDETIGDRLASALHEVIPVGEELLHIALYALLQQEGIAAEGAGVIGIGALLSDPAAEELHGRVLLIISGGNVSPATLSRAFAQSISEPRLRILVGLRALRQTLEIPVSPRSEAQEVSTNPAEPNISQKDLWSALLDQISVRLDDFAVALSRHTETAGLQNLLSDGEVIALARAQCDLLRSAVVGAKEATEPWQRRARYRSIMQFVGALEQNLEWCSPSSAYSRDAMFFDPADIRASGVRYARYGSPRLRSLELELRDTLGLTSEVEVLAASSGMAAFQVIESFLLRDVLSPGDTIAFAPYIYFEGREHLGALRYLRQIQCPSYSIDDLAGTVLASDARVLFVDPLANVGDLPVVNLQALARAMGPEQWRGRWLVIDGTMVSGGFDPFECFKATGARVLYYESASKYLQCGLDIQMAGICAMERAVFARMARHRRNCGAILYPDQVQRFPKLERHHFLSRMRVLTRNAERLSDLFRCMPNANRLRVGFPSDWPDLGWAHGGGVVTVVFNDSGRNNRDVLDGVIERLLAEARYRELALTKGVSFGFSTTRVSAAAAMADDTDPFLRFTVGEESATEFESLAVVISETLSRLAGE